MLDSLAKIKKQDLSHSIMLISPDTFALKQGSLYIAKLLMCETPNCVGECTICQKIEHNNHADVMIFPKEKDSIAVEEMLSIVDSVLVSPYESDKKVYILNSASKINPLAQNKLLKTLEEPPENVYFILNVESEAKILPTILSRCRKIYLESYEALEIEKKLEPFKLSDSQKNEIIAYSRNSIQKALEYAEKDNFFDILEFVYDIWQNMRHSSHMLKFASKLYSLKNDFKILLNLYGEVLEDIVYEKLGEFGLVKNKSKMEWYKIVANDFSCGALIKIANNLPKINQKLERNCNINIVIDNFLLMVLEERVKCQ